MFDPKPEFHLCGEGLRNQNVTTPVHPYKIVRADLSCKLHRTIALQRQGRLETESVPNRLYSSTNLTFKLRPLQQ